MRWNKRFDSSIDSLNDKFHRPLSKHPNISLIELYAKLKLNKGYTKDPSLFLGFLENLAFLKILNTFPIK